MLNQDDPYNCVNVWLVKSEIWNGACLFALECHSSSSREVHCLNAESLYFDNVPMTLEWYTWRFIETVIARTLQKISVVSLGIQYLNLFMS